MKKFTTIKMPLNFGKMGGLLPVIVQDNSSKEVLMLGFMNQEAWEQTVKTGLVTFFSRQRQCLWQKGERSGNQLKVREIKADCDLDTILILVEASGPTCHKGTQSCFDNKGTTDKSDEGRFGIYQLFNLIKKRQSLMPKNSYTTSLFAEGKTKILEKVEEESAEVIKAANYEGKQRLIEESCDLLYHLMVLLADEDICMQDLETELGKRNRL